MCLNLPFEVKNQLSFYKVRRFKYSFCYSVFLMFKNLWGFANILFYKFFLKWRKNEDFETLWKSSLKMITLFRRCSIQLWNIKRGFNVVERSKFQHWRTQHCFNIDLMLCNVATLYQPKNNVEPTLKYLLDRSCLKQINLYKILWK